VLSVNIDTFRLLGGKRGPAKKKKKLGRGEKGVSRVRPKNGLANKKDKEEENACPN